MFFGRSGKLYDKRIGAEFDGGVLGEPFKGYVFKITGGIDRDGFSMYQGVLVNGRVRILLREGSKGYRPERAGIRKRRSVRGCIVGGDIRVLHLKVLKKGDQEIEGVTDGDAPRRLGPKRANTIRKVYKLPRHSDNKGKKEKVVKEIDPQDVRRYVAKRISKEIPDAGKKYYKAPRIQRLITSQRLRRKRQYQENRKKAVQETQKQVKIYHDLLTKIRDQRRKVHHDKKVEAQAAHAQAPAKVAAPAKQAPAKPAPAKPAPAKAPVTADKTKASQKK